MTHKLHVLANNISQCVALTTFEKTVNDMIESNYNLIAGDTYVNGDKVVFQYFPLSDSFNARFHFGGLIYNVFITFNCHSIFLVEHGEMYRDAEGFVMHIVQDAHETMVEAITSAFNVNGNLIFMSSDEDPSWQVM